ncbi:MAG: hypothetical protein HYV09_18090 [Deltaproteobacteria bacterium]|nr:hypothetical protein [Deltaproteobacteria bacterium]
MSKSITIDQLGPELRALARKMPDRVRKGLREGALAVIAQVQKEIATTKPHQPEDTGAYAAAWRKRNTKDGAIVLNSMPQALWIERGRRPGPVSSTHLLDWVRRKRLYLDVLPKVLAEHKAGKIQLERRGKRGSVHRSAVDEACKRVAFLIARKLAKEGYTPRYPLRRALEHSKKPIADAIARAMKEG